MWKSISLLTIYQRLLFSFHHREHLPSLKAFALYVFIFFSRELPFRLTYTPMGLFKLQFYAAQTMRNQWSALLGEDKGNEDEEEDGLKVRTNSFSLPFLLCSQGSIILCEVLNSSHSNGIGIHILCRFACEHDNLRKNCAIVVKLGESMYDHVKITWLHFGIKRSKVTGQLLPLIP